MHRTFVVWIVAVVVLALFVGEGRTLAQDNARATPTVTSDTVRPFWFSLANVYQGALGQDRLELLSPPGSLDRDELINRQSVDAFNSLEDGQPGSPGEWELELNFGTISTSDESDPITFETELQYTFGGSDFLRNMQLSLEVPVEMGNGDVDGNADLEFEWQQRWYSDDGVLPTLSTLAEVRIPSGYDSEGVDGGLTGIVAKDLGPGTLYLNVFLETVNGDNEEDDTRDFQWGGVLATS